MGTEPKLRNDSTRRLIEELRGRYFGPASGEQEMVRTRPDRAYLVGTLYPQESSSIPDPAEPDTALDDARDVDDDDPDELVAASTWRPASMAVSFLHDAPLIECSVFAATYGRVESALKDATAAVGVDDAAAAVDAVDEGDERDSWVREPLHASHVVLDADAQTQEQLFDGRLMIAVRTRRFGGLRLSTVSVRNLRHGAPDESQPSIENCLFQVRFECATVDGRVHPYPSASAVQLDKEAQELALRYRGLEPLAVGHGVAATWDREGAVVTRVVAEPLPVATVQLARAREDADDPVFDMGWLASEDTNEEELRRRLFGLVNRFGEWVKAQRSAADDEQGALEGAAVRIAERAECVERRMRGSVKALFEDPDLLMSFRLANRAMRDQMRRPGARKPRLQPRWRPFQLAFVLLALESTADPDHLDRETVDLIWFQTGGGKTEAYLFLTAFELVRRRLRHGVDGGGTAVITRYTLRLLTTQQFQRAASLICALELIRGGHPVLKHLPGFSIGLWVGGETTPNSYKDAYEWMKPIRGAKRPVNRFQLDRCPWCESALLPQQWTSDAGRYGVRASTGHFEFFCPDSACAFHDLLPVQVVDEGLYSDPPSVLLATVDKFAQLAWRDDAGRLLGRGVPVEPPSLVIQDELHLLSGPLGTTVAVYEAAIEALIGWAGVRPKVVASTATIRASVSQVSGLFGRPVALFPPSGIKHDDDFFSEPDPDRSRIYVGLMPQAHTPSYATVRAAGELLQAPVSSELSDPELDSYWTVVGYHHSFRELGRTLTLVRDDVVNLLRARGADGHLRELRSDGTLELTSRLQPADLVDTLRRMEQSVTSDDVVDFVACTNMLSVGIDVGRLGLMLMNGQPKTNAEYIQATSRVGRAAVPGVVITLFRSSRARDRSHYEGFFGFHEALYRGVEPTSVTPWSRRSRERSLAAALIILMRHGAGLSGNGDARDFDAQSAGAKKARKALETVIAGVDVRELDAAQGELDDLVHEWTRRAREQRANGAAFEYYSKKEARLMRHALSDGDGWDVMDSMRSVEHMVRIESGRS